MLNDGSFLVRLTLFKAVKREIQVLVLKKIEMYLVDKGSIKTKTILKDKEIWQKLMLKHAKKKLEKKL